MRLSDVWFTALSENESGQMITVYGRDELNEFTESGKFKERVEITWKYEGDGRGLPSDDLGEKMEAVEEALRKAMEKKDKLAIRRVSIPEEERRSGCFTHVPCVYSANA